VDSNTHHTEHRKAMSNGAFERPFGTALIIAIRSRRGRTTALQVGGIQVCVCFTRLSTEPSSTVASFIINLTTATFSNIARFALSNLQAFPSADPATAT